MSASSDAVSGAHSGGLATTVLPAASAGPIRQVASISGAFQGVMIAATPAGIVGHPFPVAADLAVGMIQRLQVVGEEPEVVADPRHHAAAMRSQQRTVVAGLDPGQVLGPLVDPGGDGAQDLGPLGGLQSGPGREGRTGGGDGGVDLVGSAGVDLGDDGLVDG